MAEAEQTKTCPLCAETIKAKAKVCPYCRKCQFRGFFISRFDLIGIGTLLVLMGVFIFGIHILGSGRSFSGSRGKFEVLNSNLRLNVSGNNTNIVVSGILTNGSNFAWQNPEFEVRYLDSAGKIVDADIGQDEFTVPAHCDHSFNFNLEIWPRQSIPEHSSYIVLVHTASDPRKWFTSE